jgi:hypothetical protein
MRRFTSGLRGTGQSANGAERVGDIRGMREPNSLSRGNGRLSDAQATERKFWIELLDATFQPRH